MKLYLVLFLIFQLNCLLTFGQVFDQIRIIDNRGLCLTISPYTRFQDCIENDNNQIYNFNIGSDNLPTFKSLSNHYLDMIFYNVVGPSGSDETLGKFSIITTADNKFGNSICGTSDDQLFTLQSVGSNTNKVTYNVNNIPLVPGFFLDALGLDGPTSAYQGLNYLIGGYSLRLDADCVLRIRSPGLVLWESSPPPVKCYPSAAITMQTDGNLCIYPREGVQNAVWCSGTASGTSARYASFLPPFSYGREFGFVLSNSQRQMVWGKFGKPLILDSAYILVPGSYLDRFNPNKNSLTIGKFITNGRDYLAMGSEGAIRLHKDWQSQTTKWISPIPTSEGPYTFGFQEDSNICLKGSNQNQNPTFCTGIKPNAPRYIHIPLLDSFNESFWAWVSYDSINVLSSGYFNLPSDKRFTQNPHTSTPFFSIVNSDIEFRLVGYNLNKLAPNGGFLGISKRFNTIRRLSPENTVAGYCYMVPLNDIVPYGYQTHGTWTNTSMKLIAKPIALPCYTRDGPYPPDLPPVELVAGDDFEYAFPGTGFNSLIFIDSNGKMLNHFDI